ncbi:hypothetical protein [Kluyvera ascorbata]|uniref:hypothetical protein n=1 Tax=Kluyvera ascorbata TaxID=51288 RepID=UPI002DB96F90|nr:hypothetical protein [Kluyvera ascorbata]MEB6390638.1 hypothetical protein [Kluyvera ascorbata]
MNREQFEAWYLENWGHTEDNHESLFERCQDGCGDEYYRLGVRMAYEAWQAASKASEHHLAAVVAENAGLKNAVDIIETKYMNWEGLSDAFSDARGIKTPATDAFLAEVRAQGVEMYADNLDSGADDAERDGFDDAVKFLRSEASGVRLFAAQLRQGAEHE